MNFLGCLFIFLFGIIFMVIGFARMFWNLLFGKGLGATGSAQRQSTNPFNRTSAEQQTASRAHAGNAHHEGARANSRQRRSGKIFEKNEGEYVDFEEV